MTITTTKILDGFVKYVAAVQKHQTEAYEDSPSATPFVETSVGGRYWKVISSTYGQRSVHSFVEKKTGDVLKPASWAAPAKHARGNVLSPQNGAEALSSYGIKYLR